MPEEVCALRPPAGESRAEHDVGGPARDRLDQGRDLGRVVLEVGVLDHGDLAVEVRQRDADRRAFAAVLLADDDDVLPVLPVVEHTARAVGRTVVDDDDLLVELECVDTRKQLADGRGLVVDGHDEGDLGSGWLDEDERHAGRLGRRIGSGAHARPIGARRQALDGTAS